MKKRLKSSTEFIKNNFDYFLLFLMYLIPHFFMKFDLWDDVLYKTYFKAYNYNIFSFIFRQYKYWTSRVVIEATVILFGWLPPVIWMIVDTLLIVLLYHSIFGIIKFFLKGYPFEKKYRVCQLLLFSSFPYALMATAGWLTTTINWAWMLSFFVYCIKELLYSTGCKNVTKSIGKNILFCMAFIYATNFDVAAIVMFLLLIGIGMACLKSSAYRFCLEYWEGLFITIANLVLFVVCPGNRVRMEQDALIHDTADVLELSMLGKIRMGINSAFYHYMSIPNAVLFTFCVILFLAVFLNGKSLFTKIIAFVPAGITVGWTAYIFGAYTLKKQILTYIYPDASFQVCPETEQYLAIVSALMLVFSMIYLLGQTIKDKGILIPLVVILLIWGLLPDIVLGFTSTISASILRVVSFLYLAFIGLGCVVSAYSGILEKRIIWRMIVCLGGAGAIFNFAQMIRHIMVYG